MKRVSSTKSRMDANMQLTINGFRPIFPDKIFFHDTSLTFIKIPDISQAAVIVLNISRFSREVVTMIVTTRTSIA